MHAVEDVETSRELGSFMNDRVVRKAIADSGRQPFKRATSRLNFIAPTVNGRFVLLCLLSLAPSTARGEDELFRKHVAPILATRCVGCHHAGDAKGDLDLTRQVGLIAGGESGPAIVVGEPSESVLLDMVAGDDPEMPKNGDPLTAKQVAVLRKWIQMGATWPDDLTLVEDKGPWWSTEPIANPPVPSVSPADETWARTPVDRFIVHKLREHGLAPSAEADRRTLIRRLYFDLIGLPPEPAQIDAFIADSSPDAYERLVDRLLASAHYGERWARHWLDVVHYGDTHGYDKDKPRPNAWPYRDYVVRAFNADKPYGRFIREQLAGDVLYPETRDGIEATGFISAGPWDFIGHAEVPETKIDGQIARNLDRDDMVSTTMNTFVSMTVQCARCHDHKFDPVSQEDYYSLQAVFSALDRADRRYDPDARIAAERARLNTDRQKLTAKLEAIDTRIHQRAGSELTEIEQRIAALEQDKPKQQSAAFGYHSNIEARDDVEKWVQVDLGKSLPIENIIVVGCYDNFNSIGAGFGFPRRFKIEASDDPRFEQKVTLVADHTQDDMPNPGVEPLLFDVDGPRSRYVRVTATRLATRQNDYIFALAELKVIVPDTVNAAIGAHVTSLDSIEAPSRWQRKNLVDGKFYGKSTASSGADNLALLRRRQQELIDQATLPATKDEQQRAQELLAGNSNSIAKLPAQEVVYTGTVHTGAGTFRGTGHDGGKPRVIHVLERGDVRTPGAVVQPGTVAVIDGVEARFALPDDHAEGRRRAALAEWLAHKKNPLTWRSIVNRVWQYHFGRGIVDSPNDFGRMGLLPTHPELLDWLVAEFRDGGQSMKALHRLIVTSSVYRQTSAGNDRAAETDGDNLYLWRMRRRQLDAESLRDSVLLISGRLNHQMHGPGFQDFVIDKPEHSPHYEYHRHDPDDPRSHRRSIYRFLVRSQPQPFMETLDCADPSQSVAKRSQTLTALQSLALLNNRFMVRMSEHMAQRDAADPGDLSAKVARAFARTTGRSPTADEQLALTAYAREFGLANTCRVILNLNEFVFVD